MRLPPLCRYFRGGLLFGLISFLGLLLEPRGADLGFLFGVCLGSWGGRLPAAAKTLKNRTPLVYGVICVFFCMQNRKTTRKSRRTASTDGGNLVGNTGLAPERGAIFE